MRRGAGLLLTAAVVFGCARTEDVVALPSVPWTHAPDLDLDLRAWASTKEAPLLGDVTVVLDLYRATDVEAAFVPTVPEGFRGKVDPLPVAALGGGHTQRFVLHLQPTKLGEIEIASFRVEGKRAGVEAPVVATSPALGVKVDSVLAGHTAEVEAPAPPFPPPFPWLPWTLGALGVVALLALVLWWRRRSRRARPADVEVRLPAHVTALRALARLRHAPRTTAEEIDAFYVEVSRILRGYLEERFGLHAPERTTDEFLAELNAQGQASPLDGLQRGALGGFLRQCDLVKFARAQPGVDVHEESLRTAEDLVEATRADRVPEAKAS